MYQIFYHFLALFHGNVCMNVEMNIGKLGKTQNAF